MDNTTLFTKDQILEKLVSFLANGANRSWSQVSVQQGGQTRIDVFVYAPSFRVDNEPIYIGSYRL